MIDVKNHSELYNLEQELDIPYDSRFYKTDVYDTTNISKPLIDINAMCEDQLSLFILDEYTKWWHTYKDEEFRNFAIHLASVIKQNRSSIHDEIEDDL